MTPLTAFIYFNAVLKYLAVTAVETGVTVRLIIPLDCSNNTLARLLFVFETMSDSDTYMFVES